MAKYIKKKDLKRALNVCTWYHIGNNGELVEGAGLDDEPLYKESDIWRIIKELPTKKLKNTADTPQTDCETCKYGQDKHRYAHICNECGVGINNYTPQTETQIETQNSNLTFEKQTDEPPMDEYYKDHDEFYDCDRYVITNDEGERAYNCIGCQTDCPWK